MFEQMSTRSKGNEEKATEKDLIGLLENAAALRVAKDNPVDADIFEHHGTFCFLAK